MDDIILIGGGGHCNSVIDVLESEAKFKIVGILDKSELIGTEISGYTVLGCDEDLPYLAKQYKFALVTVGQIRSPDLRIKLFEMAKQAGFILPAVISPRAYLSRNTEVGSGSIIMHDVLLNANVKIGNNCIINTKVLIEHDSEVGDNCHVSTRATVNGGVKIENNCFVGSGAITRENITIKGNCFVKAGSVIK